MSSPASGPNHSCQELLLQLNTEPKISAYQNLEPQDFIYGVDDSLSASTDIALLNKESPLNGSVAWYYITCPPENECINGHHSCNPESEECVDLADGFHCVCGKGYQPDDNSQCIPICTQGDTYKINLLIIDIIILHIVYMSYTVYIVDTRLLLTQNKNFKPCGILKI